MKVAFFSAKPYEREFFKSTDPNGIHAFTYFEARLNRETASLAHGHVAVCAFVNDRLDEPVLEQLADEGVRYIVLRSAGFNHVDLDAAHRLKIKVARVPAYSPYAVAEHAVALMMDLNRKIHRAYARVREGNFALEGLMGVDMHGLTAGIIGTGRIGLCTARILKGFGMNLLGYDLYEPPEAKQLGIEYATLEHLLTASDIITLHCPLTPDTHHLIDANAISLMKPGAMLINTSRGEVVDTKAVIEGLKSGKIGNLGLDVYEEEEYLFFQDLSDKVIQDDVFSRLLTFPNVIVTGHQAFFTRNAMEAIARVTFGNLDELEATGKCANLVSPESHWVMPEVLRDDNF
ncbi:MAG: hydroxyacid dehydrogenase [Fibrobacteres bacterium]|nr:hydroxyacid dehydrogenase [Fibrobacterota bacterium]